MPAATHDTIGNTGTHGHAIERLSTDLHIPAGEVATVYWAQLDRIGESARIDHYLSILAARNARSLLRKSHAGP